MLLASLSTKDIECNISKVEQLWMWIIDDGE
jgi:hypothetical protein